MGLNSHGKAAESQITYDVEGRKHFKKYPNNNYDVIATIVWIFIILIFISLVAHYKRSQKQSTQKFDEVPKYYNNSFKRSNEPGQQVEKKDKVSSFKNRFSRKKGKKDAEVEEIDQE